MTLKNDKVRLPDETSASLSSSETASNGSSTAAVSRKRRASRTPEDVDCHSNLSAADEGSLEVQELAQTEIDEFGSGIIEYMRRWKDEIPTRKMTHLDIVRKYIVWSKTPLSLFQEVNLQSLFIYMDAYHPGLVYNLEPSPSTTTAVESPPSTGGGLFNVANINPNSMNWNHPPEMTAPRPLRPNLGIHALSTGGVPSKFGNATDVRGTHESYWTSLDDRSIVKALLDPSLAGVGGFNPFLRNLNTPNPTISVNASNPTYQAINTSNQAIPVGDSNVELQRLDRSNHNIRMAEHPAPGYGAPGWMAGPLVPNVSAPNSV